MAEQSEEQDKSETASSFKLDRARKRGVVARGMDLGFFSVLLGFAVITQLSGMDLVQLLKVSMGRSFTALIQQSGEPIPVASMAGRTNLSVVSALAVPALIILVIVIVIEIIQLRGLTFSAVPLKPDFSRLNPAKGLKRLLSLRMLKELAKNIIKMVLYSVAAFLIIRHEADTLALQVSDGRQLAGAVAGAAGRLLLLFIVLAAAVALGDQLLTRREFAKQMRMSRREVTRENREREGEPRQKRKRRQILAEILQQAGAGANVKGADVLIVNPTHYAVALRYSDEGGDAPVVQARGRNLYAKRMRDTARREGITIIRNPRLARALYHEGRLGDQIGKQHFVAVADIYIMLRRALRDSKKT
jgi:flagellar biosynthetic protein FlhB